MTIAFIKGNAASKRRYKKAAFGARIYNPRLPSPAMRDEGNVGRDKWGCGVAWLTC